jgi:dihydroflavonol-4-reductase
VRVALAGERVPAAAAAIAHAGAPHAAGNAGSVGAGIYYVAADRSVTYGELGRLAGRACGWAVAVAPTPRPLFWVAGAVGEVVGRVRRRPTIINIDKVRESMARGWVCSDQKIREALGYSPAAPLETRFAETVAWYRAHGWL